jgi:hypothetical protein
MIVLAEFQIIYANGLKDQEINVSITTKNTANNYNTSPT